MDVAGHGVDMVECARLQEMIDRHGDRFLSRVFTPTELEYCGARKRRIEHLAGRFAAKEAVLKALGTGWRGGIAWTDVEIVAAPSGQPLVRLAGECRRVADRLRLARVLVSISHIGTHAVASAIGVADPPSGKAF